jgi:NAD(P)-dependent dehydrogenase (short-subunit alcohol dehydrogenase family)
MREFFDRQDCLRQGLSRGCVLQLDGKRFVVVGAGRGIGLAIADAFVEEGAQVVRMDTEFSSQTAGPNAQVLCDVASRTQVETSFNQAVSELGGLDGLVNTAGIERRVPAAEITHLEWDQMLDVHLRGTFLTNQAAFPHLRAQGGGRIIDFGSHAGLTPYPRGAHYSAAKGGVIAWTRSAAHEWGKFGITVNCVLPAIRTPMYEENVARMSSGEREAHDERMQQAIAIGGRLGDAKTDLTPVLIFLAGEGSRFITGELISITGGLGSTR